MKEAQKIAQKVLVLLLDISVFTWRVVREVILPNRSRKGNLLSSLLAFFVGLLERGAAFERSILRRPVVFTHKYVKQGVIVAVGFLFLLSSFEWTVGPSADAAGNGSPGVVACAPAAGPVGAAMQRWIVRMVVPPTGYMVAVRFFVPALLSSRTGPPIMGRRWLRFQVFRI
jgi:hypothetical protein